MKMDALNFLRAFKTSLLIHESLRNFFFMDFINHLDELRHFVERDYAFRMIFVRITLQLDPVLLHFRPRLLRVYLVESSGHCFSDRVIRFQFLARETQHNIIKQGVFAPLMIEAMLTHSSAVIFPYLSPLL